MCAVKINVEGDNIFLFYVYLWVSQVALGVKSLPVQETDFRDGGSIPGLGNPLEEVMATHSSIHSCLENSMGKGAWLATVHGVTKSWTGLPLFILLGI